MRMHLRVCWCIRER